MEYRILGQKLICIHWELRIKGMYQKSSNFLIKDYKDKL